MGTATRGTIVSEGLLLAGDDRLTTRANFWLNSWLSARASDGPWPRLQSQNNSITVAATTQAILVGAGNNGITTKILNLISPINWKMSDYSGSGQIRIVSPAGPSNKDRRAIISNPATNTGLPLTAECRPDITTFGAFEIRFNPIPDRAIVLSLDFQVIPDDLSSDNSIPWYPNDRTMVQAVCTDAFKYMQSDQYQANLDILAAMVREDRVKFMQVPGINDELPLDPRFFG